MNSKLQSFGLLWLRVLMGTGIAYHGYGKLFGGHMDKFREGVVALGMPAEMAWVAALSEFLGGILVALGLGTRFAAFFVFATMSVAAFLVHAQDPLLKKELALAYWTISGALIFLGAGSFSLDARLKRKK
jgi:putative oxidoreductase